MSAQSDNNTDEPRQPHTAPDDEVSLLTWLSFTWMNPFIRFARHQEIDENDLPTISMTMQSAVVYDRFRQVAGSSLLFKSIKAHRLDLFLDAAFTIVGVVFNYAGPFFLKRILWVTLV